MRLLLSFGLSLLFMSTPALTYSEINTPASTSMVTAADTVDLNSLPTELPADNPSAEGDHFTQALLQMLMTLLVFLAFIFLLSWLLKRMLLNRQQQTNEQSLLKVIEKRSLSPRSTVYVLTIDDQTLVIGESPTTLTLLGSWSEANPPASPSLKDPTTFSQLLDQKEPT